MKKQDCLKIEALTAALRECGDGVCDYCVGCQALGRKSYEDCIDNDDKAKYFVFDFAAEIAARLEEIIKNYMDGTTDPLDGDEVDEIIERFRNFLNLHNGNITDEEYEITDALHKNKKRTING